MTRDLQISDAAFTAREQWRDIPGWEGLYQASSEGRVRSLVRTQVGMDGYTRTHKSVILKITRTPLGYGFLQLRTPGIGKRCAVNRLVCAAFHGPPPSPNHQAAHNDGNSRNDSSANLRWATPKENAADKVAHGTAPGMDSMGIFNNAQRAAIRRSIDGETISQLMSRLRLSHGTAARILQEARTERELISHHEKARQRHADRVISLYADGKTVGEIADIVGRSKPAVYVLLRTRGLLRRTRKSRNRNPQAAVVIL